MELNSITTKTHQARDAKQGRDCPAPKIRQREIIMNKRLILFARHEDTNDVVWKYYGQALNEHKAPPQDVVLYHDASGKKTAGRVPWHYSSKPPNRAKTYTLNCYKYGLVWIE